MVEVTIRDGAPDDGRTINEAYNEVFHQSRSLAEWRWKFPTGASWITVMFDDYQRVIAHFAAVAERLQVDSQVLMVGQAVDVFRIRRPGTEQRSVFKEVGEAFFRTYRERDNVQFIFGFPGEHSLQVGIHYFGYVPGRKPRLWRRPVSGGLAGSLRMLAESVIPGPPRGRAGSGLEPPSADRIDALWRRSAARYRVALVRDSERIRRRYRSHPERSYHYLSITGPDGLAALAVVLQDGATLRWVDLLWDGYDPSDLGLLQREVLRLAGMVGAVDVVLWLEGDAAAEEVLRQSGWAPSDDDQQPYLAAISWRDDPKAQYVLDALYYTLGDSDLV